MMYAQNAWNQISIQIIHLLDVYQALLVPTFKLSDDIFKECIKPN